MVLVFANFSCNFKILDGHNFYPPIVCLKPESREDKFKSTSLSMVLKLNYLSVEFCVTITNQNSSAEDFFNKI
jgi:hypothetical protein